MTAINKRFGGETSYPFTDLASGRTVVLHVDPPGVQHAGCDQMADVSPHLDAFYCTSCGWNGRISGAWYMALTGGTR